jgi:hypothetical protein
MNQYNAIIHGDTPVFKMIFENFIMQINTNGSGGCFTGGKVVRGMKLATHLL